jgi:hypothetical protein
MAPAWRGVVAAMSGPEDRAFPVTLYALGARSVVGGDRNLAGVTVCRCTMRSLPKGPTVHPPLTDRLPVSRFHGHGEEEADRPGFEEEALRWGATGEGCRPGAEEEALRSCATDRGRRTGAADATHGTGAAAPTHPTGATGAAPGRPATDARRHRSLRRHGRGDSRSPGAVPARNRGARATPAGGRTPLGGAGGRRRCCLRLGWLRSCAGPSPGRQSFPGTPTHPGRKGPFCQGAGVAGPAIGLPLATERLGGEIGVRGDHNGSCHAADATPSAPGARGCGSLCSAAAGGTPSAAVTRRWSTRPGVVSFTGAGTCTLDTNQAGDAGYSAAPQVQQSFTVTSTVPPPCAPTSATATITTTATITATATATARAGADLTATRCSGDRDDRLNAQG